MSLSETVCCEPNAIHAPVSRLFLLLNQSVTTVYYACHNLKNKYDYQGGDNYVDENDVDYGTATNDEGENVAYRMVKL